jgi:hypothetical protein
MTLALIKNENPDNIKIFSTSAEATNWLGMQSSDMPLIEDSINELKGKFKQI